MNKALLIWEMLGRRIRKKERDIRAAIIELQEAQLFVQEAEEQAREQRDGLKECLDMIDAIHGLVVMRAVSVTPDNVLLN